MSKLRKPGEDNVPHGEYIERGPRGGNVPNARQVTIDPGDRLPPTQEKGRTWEKKQEYEKAIAEQWSFLFLFFFWRNKLIFQKYRIEAKIQRRVFRSLDTL